MKKLILFRLGRDVHSPKLIGAFVLFAALLMFFYAGAKMFDSWDILKETNNCLQDVAAGITFRYGFSDCREIGKSVGVLVRQGQEQLTLRQFWAALLWPIAELFFWAAVLIFGALIYRTGTIVVPIEQSIHEIKEPVKSKKTKK